MTFYGDMAQVAWDLLAPDPASHAQLMLKGETAKVRKAINDLPAL